MNGNQSIYALVECCVKHGVPRSSWPELEAGLRRLLVDCTVLINHDFAGYLKEPLLSSSIESVSVAETQPLTESSFVHTIDCQIMIHIYTSQNEVHEEPIDDEGVSTAFSTTTLPSRTLNGLWQSLHYERGIQYELLRYVNASLTFSLYNVDTNLISFNHLILLHGPPGTGKTSLCRALAHKMAIRLSGHAVHLLEIKAHELFSKWFSESGKLIARMFDEIEELTRNECNFVFVLVDEVESLIMARRASLQGNEPSDSVRAVNALLTQLDKLKTRSNVIIMATSNIIECLDEAFMDRVDWSIRIPLPSIRVAYTMLVKATNELMRVHLISPFVMLAEYEAVELTSGYHHSLKLLDVCKEAEGISGRALKRLPFLAYTRSTKPDIDTFLANLSIEIRRLSNDK
jgi:hypothetical protein